MSIVINRKGYYGNHKVFEFYVLKEVAGAGTFDTSQTVTDTPTLTLTQVRPQHCDSGKINRIYYRIKATNAVTYTLRLWRQAVANNYESSMNMLYESSPLRVSDTVYDVSELDIPITSLGSGLMYYSLEWTGATGNVQGFINVSGEAY